MYYILIEEPCPQKGPDDFQNTIYALKMTKGSL